MALLTVTDLSPHNARYAHITPTKPPGGSVDYVAAALPMTNALLVWNLAFDTALQQLLSGAHTLIVEAKFAKNYTVSRLSPHDPSATTINFMLNHAKPWGDLKVMYLYPAGETKWAATVRPQHDILLAGLGLDEPAPTELAPPR